MKKKKFLIPLYFGELVVIKVDDWEKVNKKYNTEIKNCFEAVVFRIEKKSGHVQYFAAFKDNTDVSVIAHEAVHVVNQIYVDRIIELDKYNDEPQAYLMGWVVDKINGFLNKKK